MEKLSDREFIEKWKPVSGYILNDIFQDALVRLEALVKANEERDLTPEEAQLEVTKRFGQGSEVAVAFEINSDWTWTKQVTLFNFETDVIAEGNSFHAAFAAAEEAQKGKPEGKQTEG